MLEFCLVPEQQDSYCHTGSGWPRLCLHVTNFRYTFAFLRFSTLLLKLNSESQDFSCMLQISRLAFSHGYAKPIQRPRVKQSPAYRTERIIPDKR